MLSTLSLIAAIIHAQAEQLPADLYHAAATDRGKDNSTVDVHYKLNIPPQYFKGAQTPTYDAVMTTLHGTNVWKDPRLPKHIKHLGITGSAEPDGSPLKHGILHRLLWTVQPRCFLEVGVFRGSTSTHVAKFMDSDPALADSFVISLDTWLHDARFVWPAELKESVPTYMNNNVELAGSSQMYFTFLANVLATNTSHRIVPLQSASTNGAMALLAHRIRPNLMSVGTRDFGVAIHAHVHHERTRAAVPALQCFELIDQCAVVMVADRIHGCTAQVYGEHAAIRRRVEMRGGHGVATGLPKLHSHVAIVPALLARADGDRTLELRAVDHEAEVEDAAHQRTCSELVRKLDLAELPLVAG